MSEGSKSQSGMQKLEELTAKLQTDPYSSLDTIFDRSIDLLCIVDDSGYFLKVSKSFTNELGWSGEELMSKPFLSFMHPDDIEPSIACWKKTQDGHPTIDFKNRYKTKAGDYKTLVWSLPGLHNGIVFSVAKVEKVI